MNGINPTYIQGYASSITGIINGILVPVLISIAFIVFLWGIYNYFIKGADNEEARKTGKTFALYGIIGFVVLFSVWGIVQIFMGTLGLTAGNVPAFPLIGTGSGSSVNPAYGTTGSGTTFPGAGTSGGTTGTVIKGGSCTSDSSCSANLVCTSGTCVLPIGSNGCAAGSTIGDYGGCVPVSSNSVSRGGSCATNSDCSANLVCTNNACVLPTESNGCAVGSTLDDYGGCVPVSSNSVSQGGSCASDSDCSGGLTCSQNTCVMTTGSNGCATGYVLDDYGGCVPNDNQSNYEVPPDNYNPDNQSNYEVPSDN
ncbi:MAG: pilin [Candidatus Kaiserbacteria bacterium]|nr:pilin [Candidatus Kaiserbacteria bacterium]